MSFQHPDGSVQRHPPEGWTLWWRRRTRDVCQQLIQERHEAMLREMGIHVTELGGETAPDLQSPRVVVPQLMSKKRKRRR